MLYLALYCLLNIAFAQVLRFGQRFGPNVLRVGAINYVVAALASIAALLWVADVAAAARAAGLILLAVGALNGVLYVSNLLALLAAYRHAGVGVAIACANSGVVLAVIVSFLVWREPMGLARWVGVALLPMAVFLLRPLTPTSPSGNAPIAAPDRAELALAASPARASRLGVGLRGDLTLLATFMITGTIMVLHKFAQEHGGEVARPAYQAALFSAAAFASVAYTLARPAVPAAPAPAGPKRVAGHADVAIGVVLGLVNAGATLFLILSLIALPAVVVIAAGSSLNIAGNAVVSYLAWRERLTARQLAGLAAAVAIVVLVNV